MGAYYFDTRRDEFVCLNICLTSQSIKFLRWTTNLTGDGWASGKIEQLCDWPLITERFPLICQMRLPFGESDLLGLSWQPPLGSVTLFVQMHFQHHKNERNLCRRFLWIPFGETQLFQLILLKFLTNIFALCCQSCYFVTTYLNAGASITFCLSQFPRCAELCVTDSSAVAPRLPSLSSQLPSLIESRTWENPAGRTGIQSGK